MESNYNWPIYLSSQFSTLLDIGEKLVAMGPTIVLMEINVLKKGSQKVPQVGAYNIIVHLRAIEIFPKSEP